MVKNVEKGEIGRLVRPGVTEALDSWGLTPRRPATSFLSVPGVFFQNLNFRSDTGKTVFSLEKMDSDNWILSQF